MIQPCTQEEIAVYVKSATARLIAGGMTEEKANEALSQVFTKRASELGLLQSEQPAAEKTAADEEVTPTDVLLGTAYQRLIARGLTEKQAEAALVEYVEQARKQG